MDLKFDMKIKRVRKNEDWARNVHTIEIESDGKVFTINMVAFNEGCRLKVSLSEVSGETCYPEVKIDGDGSVFVG